MAHLRDANSTLVNCKWHSSQCVPALTLRKEARRSVKKPSSEPNKKSLFLGFFTLFVPVNLIVCVRISLALQSFMKRLPVLKTGKKGKSVERCATRFLPAKNVVSQFTYGRSLCGCPFRLLLDGLHQPFQFPMLVFHCQNVCFRNSGKYCTKTEHLLHNSPKHRKFAEETTFTPIYNERITP